MKHKTTAPTVLREWFGEIGVGAACDALSAALPDRAVFAVDSQRRIVWWSAGAEALLGFKADEVLGENCLTANRCAHCMVGCGIAEHGAIEGVPLSLFRADGGLVRVRKTAQAFFDEDGNFRGGLEVLSADTEAPSGSQLLSAPAAPPTFHGLMSDDDTMRRVFQVIRNVAETSANTLVRGESGTGKELVARALHHESDRAAGPFVAINCAALTPSLMESELFGHVRGAFTGASRDRQGIFEQADGGTLFLDEVAELPLDLQAKLLRVIEQRVVVRVGASARVPVDVRLVSATHRSLRAEVGAGRFREDLMYRLRVVPIFLPPLRERRGDVELLLWHFIGQLNIGGTRVVDRIAPDVMRLLLDHHWPGNVRELKNVVEYAFAVGRGPELCRAELPPEFREAARPQGKVKGFALGDEKARIEAALRASGGHLGKTAEMLGISRPTLWRKRRKYGL